MSNVFLVNVRRFIENPHPPELDNRQKIIEHAMNADPGFPEFWHALELLKRAREMRVVVTVSRKMRNNLRKAEFSRGWGRRPWLDVERERIMPGRTAFGVWSALRPNETRLHGKELLVRAREAGAIAGQRSIEALSLSQHQLPETHKDVIRYVGLGTIWRKSSGEDKGETAIPCIAAYKNGPWVFRWVSLSDTFGTETRLLVPVGSSRPSILR